MRNNSSDVSILSLLKPLVKQVLEEMMNQERSDYLTKERERIKREGLISKRDNEEKETESIEEKQDPNLPLSSIKANGYYKRNLKTIIGEIEDLMVPRTRDNKFHSLLIPYKKRSSFDIDKIVQAMFVSGVSTRKIGNVLKELLGFSLSPTTISNMTNIAEEEIRRWRTRKLHREYAVIFLDATYFPLKRNSVEKEAIYVVSGILPDGYREIVGYWIPGGDEKASVWRDILIELKEQRGVEHVHFIVSDDIKGIEDVISDIFPDTIHQLCLNHIMRNIAKYVRKSDRQEILMNFKDIYSSKDKKEAERYILFFIQKWRHYPKIVKMITDKIDLIINFLTLPEKIRIYVYTNNSIERLFKEIKRRLKSMEMFQSEASGEKILYLLLTRENDKYLSRKLKYWEEEFGRWLEKRKTGKDEDKPNNYNNTNNYKEVIK